VFVIIPQVVTDEHEESRKALPTDHYSTGGEGFLFRIFTGADSRVHHFEPESK
jgi:hypothetical protein